MIEIKKGASGHWQIVIDRVIPDKADPLIDNVFIDQIGEDNKFRVAVFNGTVVDKLLQCRISDFSQEIRIVELYTQYELIQEVPEITGAATLYKDNMEQTFLVLIFLFSAEDWKYLWSIREYQTELKQIVERENSLGVLLMPEGYRLPHYLSPEPSVGVSFTVKNADNTIDAEVHEHIATLNYLHELTKASLLAKLHSESVVMHFDFPEEVRVPCEQYLLYFAQFLRDLGVETETALTHEAGQVLFTVTPTDKEEALDNIREALDTYLHLPSNPVSESINESIAVQRLESNILRLRSDLKLAAAEIQAKNATIQAHELTISIQKGLLSGEIIVDSLKDVTPKPKDKEEILGGTFALKKYEGKGFDLDLPKIFRHFKRLFKNKEESSSEET